MNLDRLKVLRYARIICFFLLIVQIVQMATFSIVESFNDSVEIGSLFSSAPFWIVWGIICALAITIVWKSTMSKPTWVLGVHMAFVFILLGLFSTYFFSEKGVVNAAVGRYTDELTTNEGKTLSLPFRLKLRKLDVQYYEGTDIPMDYTGYITIARDKNTQTESSEIGMHSVLSIENYNIYLKSFDSVNDEVCFIATYDPFGEAITYLGYVLLCLSLIGYGFDKSRWLALFKNPLLKGFTMLLLVLLPYKANACGHTFGEDVAEDFGRLHILYKGRITLLETYALDFTKKICEDDGYKGYNANQIVAGIVFNESYWCNQKIIKTKAGYYSYNKAMEVLSYSSTPYSLREELSDKVELFESLKNGKALKVFPFKFRNDADKEVVWLSPVDTDPRIDQESVDRVKELFNLFKHEITDEYGNGSMWIKKLIYYQNYVIDEYHGSAMDWLEHFHNRWCKTKLLGFLSLVLGVVPFVFVVILPERREKSRKPLEIANYIIFSVILLVLLIRTFLSGHLQVTNGFEMMTCVALLASGLTITFSKRVYSAFILGFLVSGFALVLSSMGLMNPEITQTAPELTSIWMSLHVILMMTAYTLSAFMFVCSCTSLTLWHLRGDEEQLQRYTVLNRIMLYPAVMLMCGSIFIGAVWAKNARGIYWNWNPKETWALITMLLYSFGLHRKSLRRMDSPLFFQWYMVLCFFALLVTQFGVNYFYSGMQGYSN